MERPIESILEKYTLDDLRERVELVAMNYEHILGVLAIGSLIQLDAPDDFYTPRHAGRAAQPMKKSGILTGVRAT